MDGVTIMRVVISIFENLQGMIDNVLPHLVGMLLAELKLAFENSAPKNYKSMLLQTLSMALNYNSASVLQIIEAEGQTFAVFGNWLAFMKNFTLEFEIRRVIFGFLAILKTPGEFIPQMVQQQLPQITKQLGELASRTHKQRVDTLEKNEKYIKDGFESDDDDEESDEDGEAGEQVEFNQMKEKMKKAMK